MGEVPDALVEKAAEAIYPDVMSTWEDQWPLWEYADDQQAEFMRDLARAVLAAVWGDLPAAQPTVDPPCIAGKEFHDEWIEDLCHLIPEGDESRYSNPEGDAESIILDCFRAYTAERDALVATVDRVRAELLRGGQTPAINLRAALRALDGEEADRG